MKETFLKLLRYHAWANARLISVLETLSPQQADQEIASSFPSIRKTVYHLWGAEDIWLQRLQKKEKPRMTVMGFQGSFAEALELWQQSTTALFEFAEGLTDDDFASILHSHNLQGEAVSDLIGDIMQQLVIHGSYHRGQLVTMLRQAGITTIPRTDFIAFARG